MTNIEISRYSLGKCYQNNLERLKKILRKNESLSKEAKKRQTDSERYIIYKRLFMKDCLWKVFLSRSNDLKSSFQKAVLKLFLLQKADVD